MQAIEFETEISGAPVVEVLPETEDELEWQRAAYKQFMREDDAADAVYDQYEFC